MADDERTDRIVLVPRDGSEGRIILELPLSVDLSAEIMRAAGRAGFDFEGRVRRSQE